MILLTHEATLYDIEGEDEPIKVRFQCPHCASVGEITMGLSQNTASCRFRSLQCRVCRASWRMDLNIREETMFDGPGGRFSGYHLTFTLINVEQLGGCQIEIPNRLSMLMEDS